MPRLEPAFCQTHEMIAVTILYPRTDDSSFDMEYYTGTHLPMLAEALGDACTGWGAASVPKGNWMAFGWATVTSHDAWNAAMGEHGTKIMGDVPNYTNVRPEMVIGDVAHTAY